MKFLTSAPNFKGVSWPPWPGLPAPLGADHTGWQSGEGSKSWNDMGHLVTFGGGKIAVCPGLW